MICRGECLSTRNAPSSTIGGSSTLPSLAPVCAAHISRARARPLVHYSRQVQQSPRKKLFLPSTQGSEAAKEQTKSSFVMCGAAAVCASLTRSRAIQPWFNEPESVSNVSKRPIVRCLQRFRNATLRLDCSSHLFICPSSPLVCCT